MSLYKTGTVSVNNGQNTVTGNGTSFIDVANVQLGDLFTVDGSKFYEIYQVDTNTQVRIRNIVTGGAFAETTVTDGDYAIVRNFTSQTSAEIAAKVLAVQQKWQNREEEMTDWFYTADNWADVTSINGDQLTVMTPNGINNLLGPGAFGPDCTDYGLGVTSWKVYPSSDLDDVTIPSGFYRVIPSDPSSGTRPTGFNSYGYIQVYTYDSANRLQVYTDVLGNRAHRMITSDSQGDWRVHFDTGNSVNPLDYGVGGVNKLPDTSSLQGSYENGFYYLPNATSRPSANASNWYLRVENVLNNSDFRKYTASPVNLINGSAAEYTCIRSNGVFSEWERNFTSANTNFNEFGGDSGDWVADGYAENSTTIIFRLDWNGISTPTALSIISGNFNIKNKTTGDNLVSNITSLTLSSESSRKSAVVQYTTTGLTGGTHYRLDAGATASFLLIS